MRVILHIAVLMILPSISFAGQSLSAFPESPVVGTKYIVYVHGRIIERDGTTAVSPRFGAYNYHGIVEALADGSATVIADVREGDTSVDAYSRMLADQIRFLISKGVDPSDVTIAGFSKGGYMALMVANELQHPDVNFVIMAGCVKGHISGDDRSADGLKGRILSIVDVDDDLGVSCQPPFERNPQLSETRDIVIQSGLQHGLFYVPDERWTELVLAWVKAR